jgi:hypothetical protein
VAFFGVERPGRQETHGEFKAGSVHVYGKHAIGSLIMALDHGQGVRRRSSLSRGVATMRFVSVRARKSMERGTQRVQRSNRAVGRLKNEASSLLPLVGKASCRVFVKSGRC